MKERPLVDFTFGIKSQAMAVLHEMNAQEVGFEVDNVSTRPWYNGREKGVLICVQNRFAAKALCVAVFEHRNSDDIEVVHWEQEVGINIPTGWEHCNQAAYERAVSTSFKSGEAWKAANHIIEGIKRWVAFEKRKGRDAEMQAARAALPGIDEIRRANG